MDGQAHCSDGGINRPAQTAYLISLGIHRARELAGTSNEELVAALDATAALSRSAMWELRRPIDAGHIFEGTELGRVLWSHCATFEKITAVPARMSQSGTERPLATEVRARLFSIAHNALTNAFVHARPGRVEVKLDFEADAYMTRMGVAERVGQGVEGDGEQRSPRCGGQGRFDTRLHQVGGNGGDGREGRRQRLQHPAKLHALEDLPDLHRVPELPHRRPGQG